MYLDSTALVCFAVVLLFVAALRKLRDPLQRIPGPPGLPFFGQVFSVDSSKFHMQLDEWKRKYGPVTRFTMLGQDAVVLSGIDAVREALVTRGTDFAGRPPAYRAQRITHGKDIAFQNYSKEIVALRKMAIQSLRPYGAVITRLEGILTAATSEFIEDIGSKNGRPFEINKENNVFICNVISTIIYGERLERDDPTLQLVMEMNRLLLSLMDPTSDGKELDLMPWLRHTFLARRGLAILERAELLRCDIIEKKLREAQDSLDPACPRGCLDQFLLAKSEDRDEAGKPIWDSEHMAALCLNLISGGVVTIDTAMSAMYLLLLHHQDVQEKLQNEIDSVVGRARPPTLQDTESMPYTQSFIMESLRYVTIAPVESPKLTMVDTSVGGYRIPAGIPVYVNTWSIHHEESVYPQPFEFRPERFLDQNGALLPPDHPIRTSFIAFGLGRRNCIGEQLARSRLLLFITSILQRFTLMKDETRPLPDCDPRTFSLALMLDPPNYTLRAVARY